MPPTDHPAPAPAVEPVDLEGIRADAERVLAWYREYPSLSLSMSAKTLIQKRIPALLALVASQAAAIAGLREARREARLATLERLAAAASPLIGLMIQRLRDLAYQDTVDYPNGVDNPSRLREVSIYDEFLSALKEAAQL